MYVCVYCRCDAEMIRDTECMCLCIEDVYVFMYCRCRGEETQDTACMCLCIAGVSVRGSGRRVYVSVL